MDDWQQLLADAANALLIGRPGEALQLCDRAAFESEAARYSAALMRGHILLEIGDTAGALSSFESVSDPNRPDASIDCARGLALFELACFPEAEAALRSAISESPEQAQAHYTLGLIAEFSGTGEEEQWFRNAQKIDPKRFPIRTQIPNLEFQKLVEEALAEVDERYRPILEKVSIVVSELPLVNELYQLEPRISPLSLGMMARHMKDDVPGEKGDIPVFFLFKKNIERGFKGRDEMIAAIRETVLQNFSVGQIEE